VTVFMAASRKFRNVAHNGRSAFVVDDIASMQLWRARRLEIRGHAEVIYAPVDDVGELDGAIIRIHPKRIVSVGIDDPDHEPHLLTPNNRNVTEPSENSGRN